MKKRTIAVTALAFLLILTSTLAPSRAAQQSAETLFKSGLYEEEVRGDLQKAIVIYQDLLKRFPGSREAAAKAQLHIGLCYEKLGTTEAEKAFQKVIDNYPEQSDAVREARDKLAFLLKARAITKPGTAEFKLRQIWAGPEVDTEGSVTPDGCCLSFVDLATGDLAVRDLTSGTNRRLTHIDEKQPWSEFAMLSKWSRDGRRIAYQWYGKDDILELRVYDLEDSSIRTIHRNKSPQDWSQAFDWTPDGRRVLAAFYLDIAPDQGRGTRVGLISVQDGTVETLKGHFETLPGSSSLPNGFALSPDGRFVAYDAPRTDEDSATRDIYLIALDSRTESLLVDHPENDRVIAWTPDGKGLLFSSNRTGSEDLWILLMSEGMASDSPRMLKSGFGAAGTLGITARGDLYYSAGGAENDVYVVDLGPKQSGSRPTVKKLALPNQGRNRYPDYSPDGRRMAYLTTPLGRGLIVSIFSQDTGRVQDLATRLPSFLTPRWIPPDGQALSGWVVEKDGRRAIYKVDVRTGESVPIVQMDGGLTYRDVNVWAKDGQRIFYTAGLRSDEKRYVYAYDLKTGKHERLPGSPEDACFIAVSPDGKWLALVNEHGKRSLRIMPTSGGEPREIHSFEHEDGVITPAWSADGRSIYIPKVRDPKKKTWDLFCAPVDGGEVQKIELGFLWVRYLTVSPDGRHIAFSSSGTERKPSEVWVMENFLPPVTAAPEKTLNTRMIWAGTEAENVIQVSPDGTFVAFIDEETSDLCIKGIASGKKTVVVRRATSGQPYEFPVTARWSPDGKRLAYGWFNADNSIELRMIGVDGSNARTLYSRKNEMMFPTAWSPDGRTIAVGMAKDFYKSYNIGLISAQDGSLRVLKTEALPKAPPKIMTFSPDGRFLIIDPPQKQGDTKRDIVALSVDGARDFGVVEHPAHDSILGWVPGSDRLLFLSDRTGTPDAWIVDIADGRPQGEPQLVRSNLGQVDPLGISREGSLIYRLATNLWHVFTASVDPNKGAVIEPPKVLPQPLVGADHQPQWSPDGKSLAFHSIGKAAPGSRGPMTLKIRSEVTGETREVKTNLEWVSRPSWAPDGRSLFVLGSDGKNTLALFQVQVDTGQTKFLVDSEPGANIKYIAPARDGKSVFYTYFEFAKKRSRVMSIDLATRESRELYRQDAPPDIGGLSLSPDGKWLAFKTLAPDDLQVLTAIPLPGGPPREIVRAKSSVFGTSFNVHAAFCWTPDGKRILFFRDVLQGQKKNSELCSVPAGGGERSRAMASSPKGARAISAFIPTDGVWPIRSAVRPPRSGSWRTSCRNPAASGEVSLSGQI